jgi:hypothetical protein
MGVLTIPTAYSCFRKLVKTKDTCPNAEKPLGYVPRIVAIETHLKPLRIFLHIGLGL